MKELIEHLKKIAIKDSRLFLEPYVQVGRFIRRFGIALLSRLKSLKKNKEGDNQ
ncbi:hypothetical protein [Massilia timonae]|uniref:hypothetical protein n=1 Tax=Massilia timonae TaxID=47229 RepID=UPI0028975B68|nr:hypothetical protein [Massilia timonae]